MELGWDVGTERPGSTYSTSQSCKSSFLREEKQDRARDLAQGQGQVPAWQT